MGSCFGNKKAVRADTFCQDENNKQSQNQKIFQKSSQPTHATTLQRDIRQDYKFGKPIGHGHFGTVRVATIRLNENIENSMYLKSFAVKTIQKVKLKNDEHLLKREIEMLLLCDHPNIIKLHYTYEDTKYFHLVTDLCDGGELFDNIIEKGKFNEQETSIIFTKMLSAIQHLHQNGICHRDIKPENFLLESKRPGAEIKLIDFGLSNKFGDNGKDLKTMVGTPYYVAPEVLQGKYGKECDIWSLGIVLYTMLSGSLPFGGQNNVEIFKNIQQAPVSFKGKAWTSVSVDAKNLIKLLLTKNPLQRIQIEDTFKHSWFLTATTEEHEVDPEIFQNLRNYRADIKLRKEAMNVIVRSLAVDEIQHLNKIFFKLDQDKTGYINADELQIAMEQCGMNIAQEEIQTIIKEADYVGNGKINYSEFIAATLCSKVYMTEEKLYAAFNHFDIDASGFITEANLKEAMKRANKKITDEEIKQMIRDVDLANDHQISFEEFKHMMDPQGLMQSQKFGKRQSSTNLI